MKCFPPTAAAAAAEDDGSRMVEAAEALAGMAHCSAAHVMEAVVISQDQPVVAEVDCDYAPTTITSPQKAERIVEHIPTQVCSTSRQSNPVMKLRRKLTEAEKEERKRRHVMANRESARETIRRRQAMHLDLTRKAADVLEENENLKKQKKLMVEDFNFLKGRNEFLKAQLTEVMKVAAGEVEEEEKEEPNSSEAERLCSATASAPIFMHNQPPSLVPCFWPPLVQSSDAFPFQCASHPRPSQYPMPPGDSPCLHQGQEHSRGTPYFIVPVPWLLPFLTGSSASGANTHYCGKCSCSDSARPSEDNNQLLPNQNMRADAYNHMQTMSADAMSNQLLLNQNMRADAYNHMQTMSADGMTLPHDSGVQSSGGQPPVAIVVPGLFSPVRRPENLEPPRTCQVGDTNDLRSVSAHENESTRHGLCRTSGRKPRDAIVASEARRRRKELMRLKNVNCK